MKSGKVLLGLLAGIAVGATLGILFAPDKGTNTRKKISQKGGDYADELKGKFDDFIKGITDKLHHTSEDASEILGNKK